MSVLIFTETEGGVLKKSSLQAVAYGLKTAQLLGVPAVALSMNSLDEEGKQQLANTSVEKVLVLSGIDGGLGSAYAEAVEQVASAGGTTVVILPQSSLTESLAASLAAKMKASLATGVVDLPKKEGSNLVVRRSVYTGKAFCETTLTREKKVISIKKNSFSELPAAGGPAPVSPVEVKVGASSVEVVSEKKVEGDVLLPEAELVVSAGRGLKGPENWGMVEELAKSLGAATACSKPVSDADWRPHHEHVGQTGIKIAPNLYIAIGISGAIQHLAGVSASKTIVVINNDPEAPFFKSADYGIVGDAFDVVPKLTEAFKRALA